MADKWKVFSVVALGIFMSTLDGSVLNIANPSIASEFAISMATVQWAATAYLLVVTATMLFFGRLGDKYGSHRIFIYGFLVFTLGSLGCSLAPNFSLLIAARIIQAIGGSMLVATGMGLIANAFSSRERGKALGLAGSVVGIGNMTGPALGGLIVGHFHWSVIFLINVPIGIAAFFLGLRHLKATPKNEEIKNLDLPGFLLFAILICSLLLSTNLSHTGLLLGAAGIALAALVIWERKNPQSFVDKALLHNSTFVLGNILLFICYFTQMAAVFLTPFYLERILELDPAMSGFIMAINPITLAMIAPLAGILSDKFGSKKIVFFSFIILSIAFYSFSAFSLATTATAVMSSMMLLGIGMGCFSSPNNSEILGSIPVEKQGYGGGFIGTVRNLGFTFGVACSSNLFTYYLNSYQVSQPYADAYIYANRMVFYLPLALLLLALLLAGYDLIKSKTKLGQRGY